MNQLIWYNCISPSPFKILNSLSFHVGILSDIYSFFHFNLHFLRIFRFYFSVFLLWNFFSFFDYLCDWESIIIYCALFRQMNALWAFCAIGFTSKKQIWMSWVLITRRLISLLISLSRYGLAIIKNWIIYCRTESLMSIQCMI